MSQDFQLTTMHNKNIIAVSLKKTGDVYKICKHLKYPIDSELSLCYTYKSLNGCFTSYNEFLSTINQHPMKDMDELLSKFNSN